MNEFKSFQLLSVKISYDNESVFFYSLSPLLLFLMQTGAFCFSFFTVTNGSYSLMDEEEEGELYGHDLSNTTQHSYLQERCVSVHTSVKTTTMNCHNKNIVCIY